MSRFVAALYVIAVCVLVSSRLSAHHGAGIFDPDKTVTVAGTVTDFQFVNPHVLVYITFTDENGDQVQWAGELTSPNRLSRMSTSDVTWHRDTLKAGDEITMAGHPARNGAPAMDITEIVDGDGVVLIGR